MLIDSHAHIHFKDYENEIPQVLARASEAGVETIINVGTDLESSRQVVELAQKYPQIFAVVGIHPHEVDSMQDADLQTLQDLAKEKKVVAIGEIGLDYYYEHSPKEIQQKRLRDLIHVAQNVNLPLVIHCRDAFQDCFDIFEQEDAWKCGGVFHCYTGDLPTAEFIVKKGFYVSFSGIVTFKKSQELQEVAKSLSSDQFLIETDCPFLTPMPHRGKRNEPAYVRLVAEKVAELRQQSLEEISRITSENTKRVFRLPERSVT